MSHHVAICSLLSGWIYAKAENESASIADFSKRLSSLDQYLPNNMEVKFYPAVDIKNKLCTYAIVSANGVAYLVFRGSSTVMDFVIDVSLAPEKIGNCWITSGHYAALKTVLDTIYSDLTKLKPKQIFVTGHSLGGALAQLFGYLCREKIDTGVKPLAEELTSGLVVYSFASPLIRWEEPTAAEITEVEEVNKEVPPPTRTWTDYFFGRNAPPPPRERFHVPATMHSRFLPQFDYIINFVFDRDFVPRYPFATKFRWTVKNLLEYAAESANTSLLKFLHAIEGDNGAQGLAKLIPAIVVGYIPLGRTVLFGPTIRLEDKVFEASDHTWFTKEFDKAGSAVEDDGWVVPDHGITFGYARLYKEEKFLKSLDSTLFRRTGSGSVGGGGGGGDNQGSQDRR